MELVFRSSVFCDVEDEEDGKATNVTDIACQQLDRTLEAAVITSWPELVADGESGSVHVEHDYGIAGDVSFLQVWSSKTRGNWRLACSYSSQLLVLKKTYIQFETGYASECLTPSEKERTAANTLITEGWDRARGRCEEPVAYEVSSSF